MSIQSVRIIKWDICLLLVLYLACLRESYAQKTHSVKIKTAHLQTTQGVCGIVLVKRGNYMPSPDAPRRNPNGAPVEREVLIFPLLNQSQVDAGENGFINSVRDAKPVATVKSKADGTFCANVPPGRYSVIVREPKGLYANLSDTQNNICPVTVEKGKQAQIKIDITHQAVF